MHIFISYSRDDGRDIGEHLYKTIIKKSDVTAFYDQSKIEYGDPWKKIIFENIEKSNLLISILTRNALESEMVDDEITHAQKKKIKIIPCKYKDSSWLEVKWSLQKVQGIEFEEKEELIRKLQNIFATNAINIKLDQTIPTFDFIQPSGFDTIKINNFSYNKLKDPSELEVEQYIHEIESSTIEEKEKLFNDLQDIAKSKRLYKDKKIRTLCDKYIAFTNDDDHLVSRVLDFIKQMLATSINIDNSQDFLKYVKSKYSPRFREIILSIDKNYENSKFQIKQIIERYDIFEPDEVRSLYWKSINNNIHNSDLPLNEFLDLVTPYFNKINDLDSFKMKCRSEMFTMSKSEDERIKQRSKALMNFFSKT